MLKHNSYFDGQVQSIGFERHGRRSTVGVITPGQFKFSTEAPERMTVLGGELAVLFTEDGTWKVRITGQQGSGVLRSMSEANCYIVLEHERGRVESGELVSVQLLATLA